MSNPTRQEILAAHNAILDLQYLAEDSLQSDTSTIRTLGEHIVAALPPKPQPTMAEIEWDDDKHYLAEAEHPDYGKVIMVNLLAHSERISVLFRADVDVCQPHVLRKDLTPTGRRHTLTEVHND